MENSPVHTILVREAIPDDTPQISQLLTILFEQEAEFTPDPHAQTRGIHRIIENPESGGFYLLEIEGQTQGVIGLQYQISTALGGDVAMLEDFVIRPRFRGQGYGRLLLKEAIHQAKKRGCLRITLLTDEDNQKARGLYQEFGFTPSQMIPMRQLLQDI